MPFLPFFSKKYTLQDLDNYIRVKKEVARSQMESKCRILIIDDSFEDGSYPFDEQLTSLRNQYNLSITAKSDLENLYDAEAYDLIICDNQGIGIKIYGRFASGLNLLKGLIEKYPHKNYVLCSNVDVNINNFANNQKDLTRVKVWSKDVLADNERRGADSFSEKVRAEVDYTLDPVARWKMIRRNFISKTNISLSALARLEDAYVKSIMLNNPSYYERASRRISSTSEPGSFSVFLLASKSIVEFTISILSLL